MARTPHAVTLVTTLALALPLSAGCGADRPSPDTSAREERQRPRAVATDPTRDPARRTPSESPAERRTTAPETPPPAPTGNALTIESRGVEGHLLSAGELGSRWSVTRTGGEAGRLMSECHRASMSDVGAQETRLRDFTGPGAAVQGVSRFVDPKSAWRVEQVVIAWAEDCADNLRARDAALGAVRHGSWVSVVEIAGVDEPRQRLRSALAAVAATF